MGRELGDLATVLPIPRPLLGVRQCPARAAHLGRYFASTVPADVVAFFDCDMVLCGSVATVWEVAPGRVRAVADRAKCVADILAPKHRAAFAHAYPEVAAAPGINAGLFSLRPADWPYLPERFEHSVRGAWYGSFPGRDQPFANEIFLAHTDLLPGKYNAHCVTGHPIPRDVRVVHFTGSVKPWMPNYPRHEPAYYYWLRHGAVEVGVWQLARAKLRIWARTPRRLVSRFLRSLASPSRLLRSPWFARLSRGAI